MTLATIPKASKKQITRQEAADRSGFTKRTIDRLIRAGAFQAFKYQRAVRIELESFEKWRTATAVTSPAHIHQTI